MTSRSVMGSITPSSAHSIKRLGARPAAQKLRSTISLPSLLKTHSVNVSCAIHQSRTCPVRACIGATIGASTSNAIVGSWSGASTLSIAQSGVGRLAGQAVEQPTAAARQGHHTEQTPRNAMRHKPDTWTDAQTFYPEKSCVPCETLHPLLRRAAALLLIVPLAACENHYTAPAPSVALVAFSGPSRLKAGGSGTYTIIQKLPDNTVVTHPVSYSVSPAGAGTVTQDGKLTPTTAGVVSIVATVDGIQWPFPVVVYDWSPLNALGLISTSISATTSVANRFGTADYPSLDVICSTASKLLTLAVDVPNIITASGVVVYNGTSIPNTTELWLETSTFHGLVYGASNANTKALVGRIAGGSRFLLAFNEFSGPARIADFDITGMSAAIAPVLAACQ